MLGDVAPEAVRVRFCPSPTGNPHVGLIRSALFNWAFARHYGGTFVFRIEDTDVARDSEQSYEALLAAFRWLGLSWDEGPEVGGPHRPYRQSERRDLYADIVRRLLHAGHAYHCYCTPEEVDERKAAARAAGGASGYDGACRTLTAAQVAAYEREGRRPVVRFRMPDTAIAFDDLVFGAKRWEPENLPDYVLVRATGDPLYPLVNPVDDAVMGITHVLRGEDLLPSTPRQIPLHEALRSIGATEAPMPRFGHLPMVIDESNKKLSKREPKSSLQMYRDRGFLPEALLNYLALLGWSIGGDREIFSLGEMVEAFDVTRVNPNPAQFDLRKAEALNGVWLRRLEDDDLAARMLPYLQAAGVLPDPPSDADVALLQAATPLVRERMVTLDESAGMLGFLFAEQLEMDEDAAAKVLTPDAVPTLEAARKALVDVETWAAEPIEAALRASLVDGLGLKPRHAFGPVRVAVSGRRVSPPLFESLELLGRDRTLARLDGAIARAGA